MKITLCSYLLLLISINCFAQKKAAEPKIEKYWLVILKTGPKDSIVKDTIQRNKIFAGHMSNMGRLHKEGVLKVAGPFGKKLFENGSGHCCRYFYNGYCALVQRTVRQFCAWKAQRVMPIIFL